MSKFLEEKCQSIKCWWMIIYDNSSFQVQTSNGLTSHIIRGKGIIQGCPWSVIAFEQGIDRWLRWVDYEYNRLHVPCPIQASVDDVCLVTNLEKNLRTMTKKSESFLTYTGMEVKHPKCAILHGRRSGNSWMKMSTTDEPSITMQGQRVPVYAKGESYKYLGYKVSIDNTSGQTNELIIKFVDTITKVNNSCLPTSAKLEAINTMCLSLLHFYMPNLLFLEKDLLFLEDTIVKSIREYLKLNNSCTRSYFFLPKSMGGLGILNPKLLYYTSHISFYLSVLNSDDPNVRQTARHSLDLHMKKERQLR